MMNWKGFGRKRFWHDVKVLSRHSPEVIEENHENRNHDSRSPLPIFEHGASRIEAGVSTTRQ
jgi:hypothetical protein